MAEAPTFILGSPASRDRVCKIIRDVPSGAVVQLQPPRRTLPQNAKLHAMITDIAKAKPEGRVYPVKVWKVLFLAMIGKPVRFEPALDGNGIVPIPASTARLNKAECGELIDAIEAYAAQHGVQFSE